MIDLLMKRRSIRKYKDMKVPKEKVDSLIKAALLSPSGKTMTPWEFIVVEDNETIKKLAKSKQHGSSFLAESPLAIVVAADSTKTDIWVEDASIAATIIQLEAEHLGLGSCWIQIRGRMHDESKSAENYIKELLEIPENYSVECMISIGYKDEEKKPYTEEDSKYEKIHREKF
ncbi:nitroreductase family protein [Clostridium peptidivorans]|uniref:nitroreductase family protein n=1 Tax=Clostridium peptidivorans TaxID=100174 RepID=UPI000BE3574B|nr:nitroreductase family protein [Clostridium peptidivorans]